MPLPESQADPFAILQLLLDVLSDEPGALIYRGPQMWEALPPGEIGSTLILGPDLLPIWSDES